MSRPPRDLGREKVRADRAQAAAEESARRLRRDYWSAERLLRDSRIHAAHQASGRADPCDHADLCANPESDPYAVLGLVPGATLAQARTARREMAKRFHPDRCQDSGAAEHMTAINTAMAVLERMLAS